MFEVHNKMSFASEAFLSSESTNKAYSEVLAELWVPNEKQDAILQNASFQCSCCGLKSAPGSIDIRSTSVTKVFVESGKKIIQSLKTGDGETGAIKVPSGMMDILTANGKSSVLCWICRASMMPQLPVAGVYDHGVAIYAPGISQKEISNIFTTCSFAIIHIDSPISVEAERAFHKMRATLIPPVSEVIPGIMNGSIEALSEIIQYMPHTVHDGMAKYIAEIKYLPSTQAFKTHIGYWFAVSQENNEKLMAAING